MEKRHQNVQRAIDKMIIDGHNAQVKAVKGPLSYLIVSSCVGAVGYVLYELIYWAIS